MSVHKFHRDAVQTSCHDLEAAGELVVSAIPDAFGDVIVLTASPDQLAAVLGAKATKADEAALRKAFRTKGDGDLEVRGQ